ncbi:MAG: ABC transporter ATP-binding protein [Eubacteriaceae bacterium]|nr:ABC transporter ATP-binding protein [Eubacteriaceae bacterium]
MTKGYKPPGHTTAPGEVALGEKANDFIGSIKKLMKYCSSFMPAIALCVVLTVAASVFSLIGPNKLSEITDLITNGMKTGIDLQEVMKIGVFLAAIYIAGWILSYIQGFIMATVSQKATKKLRTDIVKKIDRLPLSYFDRRTYGDTQSLITNDADTIGTSLNQSLSSIMTGIFMFVGSLIMMLYTNWIMALCGLASTLIGFLLMLIIISKSQKYFAEQQRELGRLNGHIEEIYAGQTVVKAYNAEKKEKQEFSKLNKGMADCVWKSQFMSGLMMPIMTFIGNLAYVVVCVAGAVLAIKGSISFGVIVAFMVYIRLFTQPLSTLAQATTTLQSTAAACERIFDFLDEEEMSDESSKTKHIDTVAGDVSFDHVKFGYTEDKVIIKDFSADIKAGQKIAIVGPTGAGKTTMVNLLMRFYEVSGGVIYIDGMDIDELKRENVHDLFGMVLQDTWIFEGTIKENIAYSKEHVSDEDVVKACKAVGLHHFIKALPKGYDTVISDEFALSAGQKQLMTIARAMVDNAPLLILDEATSSVDTRTEILIQKAMDKLSEGRTSFVIAHRLSTIKDADLILVMNEGDVIESGNHEELLNRGGFYSDLYNSQFDTQS